MSRPQCASAAQPRAIGLETPRIEVIAMTAPSPPLHTSLLAVRGLTRAFGSTRALDGVDLPVKAGEVHALLGANGARKSTLLAIVAGIESADSGDLEVTAGGSRDRPSVAIVYQELSLLPHLSGAANIATHALRPSR